MQVIEPPGAHKQISIALLVVIAIWILLAMALITAQPAAAATCTPFTERAQVVVIQTMTYGRPLPQWVAVRLLSGRLTGFSTYRLFTVGQIVTVRGCREPQRWGAVLVYNVW